MKNSTDFDDIDKTISSKIMGEQNEDWSEQCQSCSGKGCDECNQTGEIVYTINMDATSRLVGTAGVGNSRYKKLKYESILSFVLYSIKIIRNNITKDIDGLVSHEVVNDVVEDIFKTIIVSNFARVDIRSGEITIKELLEMCLPNNLSIVLLNDETFCSNIKETIHIAFEKQTFILSSLSEFIKPEAALDVYKKTFAICFNNTHN